MTQKSLCLAPQSIASEFFVKKNQLLLGSATGFRFYYLQLNTTSTDTICPGPDMLRGLQTLHNSVTLKCGESEERCKEKE